MSLFSEKLKILYLSVLIFFCLGVFFYLLDSWRIINLEKYLPGLSSEPPLVSKDFDAPTELEWGRLEKEQKRLEEQRIKLEEELKHIQEEKASISSREEELQKKTEGLEKEKEAFEDLKKDYENRKRNTRNMAKRLQAMPPQEAIEIVANWSNTDLIGVLLQMENNAESEGNDSIVPYFLTLMPRERAALLMTLMLEEKGKAEKK